MVAATPAGGVMDRARHQVRKLVEYLIEYSRLRTPSKLEVSDYEWHLALSNLPHHPSVQFFQESVEHEGERLLLRVERPTLTACPEPPAHLCPWLGSGWQRFESRDVKLIGLEAELAPSDEDDELSEESAEPRTYPEGVLEAFRDWSHSRQVWRVEEAPARKALQLFERLFQLKGTLEREGERWALTLGDGILRWRTEGGSQVDHPLMSQRCSLTFDAEGPEFILSFAEDPPQLAAGLLRELDSPDLTGLSAILDNLRLNPFDILSQDAADFLMGVARRLWSDGEFLREPEGTLPEGRPIIRLEPVLMLTPRGRGYSEAAEHLLHQMDCFEVPTALLNLVGIDQEPSLERRQRAAQMPLLFTKPSNLEQERVARRLEANGCVLVQGPPGTGKTHTIANLIGHLLAQGKTILVTSHTSKALAVVREKVVPQLQSLCVSVLDDGRQGQKMLEMAVNAIADALTQKTGDELEVEAQGLASQRQRLEQSLAQIQSRLLEALRNEFEDLVVGGDAILPSEAAQKLRAWSGTHDWLPGEVAESQLCPLSPDEADELYHLQVLLPLEDERLLQGELPASAALMEPGQFAGLVQAERALAEEGTSFGVDHWSRECGDSESLRTLVEAAKVLVRQIPTERWQVEIVQAGAQRSEAVLWQQLVGTIREVESSCTRHRALIYQHNPQIKGLGWPPRRQIEICKELLEHARAGKKVGFFNRLLKGEWVAFRNASTVSGAPPERPEDYEGLLALLELHTAREQLRSRWALQAVPHGASELSENSPEREAMLLADTIEVCLGWESQSWRPFTERAGSLGLDWQKIWHLTLATADSLTRRRQGIEDYLIPTLEAKIRALELEALRGRLRETFSALANSTSPLSVQIREAAEQRQDAAYRQHWLRLRELEEQRQRANRRESLLARLREKAPGWARAVADRAPDHLGPKPPGPIEEAWLYAQWTQGLKHRHQLDLDALQKRASETKEELRKLTAKYVEVLTWKFQAGRTGNAQRQALIGWLETMRKIGKGTGKYADTYRAAAREKLKECRTAVPVWIMPFSKVVESYRPGETLFDVVIVDEASQADVTGLLAFTLGKEVIVVGDHEQVSPTAFEDGGRALALAKERLLGIPNSELYSGKRSVYDMARSSFGETIRLREHFRCVPEIIQFSNELCYDGDIQALRESGHAITPPIVSHRVMTGQRQGRAKTNDEEAREIVSLIAACIEQPEYDRKTIGVISMVGDEQALLIQKYLHEVVPPAIYEERRLLCGNAAQFQGDERDVMFLSFVNSPVGTGPLRIIESRQEDIQRYNVAASRAKDQMWLCHSFQPSTDLKPEDLRAKLLSHAGRCAADSVIAEHLPKTESPFEAEVLTRLVRSGYRVVPQLPVGSYRVDMVVLGRSRRIAIECDGEAYHGPDKLEADLARQQILERVAGLTFVRIRGSAYFRNPDEAMRVVLRRLEELGVEKLGAAPPEQGPEDSLLRESVVKRAQELRAQWWPTDKTAMGQNDHWAALERRLEDWPLLELTRVEAEPGISSVNISHDKEEVVLLAASSEALAEYTQNLEDSFVRFVVVDPAEPEEALRRTLEALGLQAEQDSRELPAFQDAVVPAASGTSTPPTRASESASPGQDLSLPQAVTAALMDIVKADGVILETEVQTVLELLETRFRFAETLPEIRSWVDEYRERNAAPGSIGRTLRAIPREQRELVVQSAVELGWCDGDLHPQEQSAIRALGVELDLDRMTVEGLLAQSTTREEIDPFKILGLQPQAEPEVVQATVARLREQFQAEKFLHIGAEFVELASTRRAEVERAWEMLKSILPEPQPAEPVSDEPPSMGEGGEPPATRVENTYREFEGMAGPDPRTASLGEIAAGLNAIVEVEGPVATSRLYDVYLRGCGIKRLGHELKKTLNKALARALSQKTVVITENTPKGGYAYAVVACAGGPFVLVRPRGPRSLEEVPKAELRAVAQICQGRWPAGSEEHYRGILEYYDLKKLTTNAKAILDNVLQGDVDVGYDDPDSSSEPAILDESDPDESQRELAATERTTRLIPAVVPDDPSQRLESLEQAILDRFSEEPRAQAIIKHRYALNGAEEKTLEQLGEAFGVTRERIRQIEKREHGNLLQFLRQGHNQDWELQPALVDFFAEVGAAVKECAVADVMALADYRDGLAERLGFTVPSISRGIPLFLFELEGLAVVHGRLGRTFLFRNKDIAFARDFTEWMAQLESELRAEPRPMMKKEVELRITHKAEGFCLTHDQVFDLMDLEWLSDGEFQVPLELLSGRANQAYRVLQQAGRPLHFREITERIREATGEEELSERNISNQLIPDVRLVPIGRSGLWGLAEWGAETGTVKDVITSILMNSATPLSQTEIWKQVSEVRPCAPASIGMYLADEPTFKRVGDDSYTYDPNAQRGDDWNRETVGSWIDEFFAAKPLAVVPIQDLTDALMLRGEIQDERAFKILLGHHPALHSERDRSGNTFVTYRPSWRHAAKRQRRARPTLQTEVDGLLVEMLRWHDSVTLHEAVQRLEKETDSPPSALYAYVSRSPSCIKFEVSGIKYLKAPNA